MLDLGLVGFAQPWLLLGLLALPALWLLLRVTPPAPRKVAFPALLFLLGLVSPERTPARTPPWLLILRLALAALLILALAGPVLNPAPRLAGDGPLLLVVDNGWAAAPRWQERLAVARELAQQAEREGREVVLLPTAPPAADTAAPPPAATPAAVALDALGRLGPQPWPADRAAAERAVAALGLDAAVPVWLSDGLAGSREDLAAAGRLAQALRRLGALRVHADPPDDLPAMLRLPDQGAAELTAGVERAPSLPAPRLEVEVRGPGGETWARVPVAFDEAGGKGLARLELPADMRNRVARLELSPAQGVGGVGAPGRALAAARGGAGGRRPRLGRPAAPLRALLHRQGAQPPRRDPRGLGRRPRGRRPLSLLVLPTPAGWSRRSGRSSRPGWRRAASCCASRAEAGRQRRRLRAGAAARGRPDAGRRALLAGAAQARPVRRGRPVRRADRARRGPGQPQVLAEPGPGLAAATLATLEDGTPLITAPSAARAGWSWSTPRRTRPGRPCPSPACSWTCCNASWPSRRAPAARPRGRWSRTRCSTRKAASTTSPAPPSRSRPPTSPPCAPAPTTRPGSTGRCA
jgi:hypothetical protein